MLNKEYYIISCYRHTAG